MKTGWKLKNDLSPKSIKLRKLHQRSSNLGLHFYKVLKRLAVIIKYKYFNREHFRRNFSSRKEKDIINVEIEKPERIPMISVSKLNLVK